MSLETGFFLGVLCLAWAGRTMMRHPKETARSASFLLDLFKKK